MSVQKSEAAAHLKNALEGRVPLKDTHLVGVLLAGHGVGARQAQVGDLQCARLVNQYVGGLEVPAVKMR